MVGTIIGSGIFVVPNLVARSLPSEPWILAAWVFTGVLSFFGALAYAELGAMIPATGGQYVFLREAYGPLFGFLCGWTYFFIIISAAIAWLSITFATYVAYFVPLTPLVSKVIAVGLIAAVTLMNYRGVVAGAAVQKTFTLMKVLGLAVLVGAAFLGARHDAAPAGSLRVWRRDAERFRRRDDCVSALLRRLGGIELCRGRSERSEAESAAGPGARPRARHRHLRAGERSVSASADALLRSPPLRASAPW